MEIVDIAGRIKGIADDVRPQFLQPDGQPGTLEAGVPGNKDLFIMVDIVEWMHFFIPGGGKAVSQ